MGGNNSLLPRVSEKGEPVDVIRRLEGAWGRDVNETLGSETETETLRWRPRRFIVTLLDTVWQHFTALMHGSIVCSKLCITNNFSYGVVLT